MSLQGYATAVQQTTEIACAYASGIRTLHAQASDVEWIKIGSFSVPVNVRGRLIVSGYAADGCTVDVELRDPTEVANSRATVATETESTSVSAAVDLLASKSYLIVARCTAAAEGAAYFGGISTVSLGSV
jgi:hypothetical protein